MRVRRCLAFDLGSLPKIPSKGGVALSLATAVQGQAPTAIFPMQPYRSTFIGATGTPSLHAPMLASTANGFPENAASISESNVFQ